MRAAEPSKWNRIQRDRNMTARYELAGDATKAALAKYFETLPYAMRDKAISKIYSKALLLVRDRIRANIDTRTGLLRNSVKVKRLRPNSKSKDPAAMVYMSNQRGSVSLSSSIRTRKTKYNVKGGARYAYAVEYGTGERKREQKSRVLTMGGWATTDKTGAIKAKPFFRPAIDQMRPQIQPMIMKALEVHGKKAMDRAAMEMNRKTKNIKITV